MKHHVMKHTMYRQSISACENLKAQVKPSTSGLKLLKNFFLTCYDWILRVDVFSAGNTTL